MIYVGADGCKVGWFTVILSSDNDWEIEVYPDVYSLWYNLLDNYEKSSSILLDIPIGLREHKSKERLCDLEARKLLGPRRASVFPAPCRQAIYIDSYEKASQVNKWVTNRGLSLQTWNIIPKIRDVDNLMLENDNARAKIREIHPEVCFCALSGHPMNYSKKKTEGAFERRKILREVYPLTDGIISKASFTYKRKEVANDDILDALSAAVTALLGQDGLYSIPRIPELDSKRLPMEMVYPKMLRN